MGSLPESQLQHLSQPPVTPGQHCLQEAGVPVVPVIGHCLGGDGVSQQLHPPLIFLPGDLSLPLEGGEGLGHKPGGRHRDPNPPVLIAGGLPPSVEDVIGHLRDAQHILVGFRRQAQHEVELYRIPAAGEGGAETLVQVLLRHILIDGIPQALRTRLRSKGEARLPPPAGAAA